MTFRQQKGSLLAVKTGIIVHGCNCMGVMGSGVAAQIRNNMPDVYRCYVNESIGRGLYLGDVIFVASKVKEEGSHLIQHLDPELDLPDNLVIANALTQRRFGTDKRHVDYAAISAAFFRIAILARALDCEVHYPLIGCGLGGGSWDEVGPQIEQALTGIDHFLWLQ